MAGVAAMAEAAVAIDGVRAVPPPPRPTAAPRSARRWAGLLALALVGAVAGYFVGRYGATLFRAPALSPVAKAGLLATLPLGWLLAVAWHEAGHLAGGWAVGGRFLLYIVGPFRWQRTPSGVRFSWNRSLNLAGGLAACLPTDDRDLRRRMAVMVAGGPLASLVLALLAFGAVPWLQAGGWAWAERCATLLGFVSLVILAVTAFPGEAGGFKTDGRRFLALLQRDAAADQEAALLSLTVLSLGGMRPADYPPEVVAAGTAVDDGCLNAVYGHFNAFHHAADRGDLPSAQLHLDRVIAGEAVLPPFMRDVARAEYAWLLAEASLGSALGEGTALAQAGRAWLDGVGPVDFDPATRLRAEAAVLLAEGKTAEAARQARAGLLALETRSLAPVRSPFAADALGAILRRAEAGRG